MENQFILRLPDSLLDVDPKDCSLTKLNNREITFTVKGKSYPGLIARIPTIVESQKMVDNKFYKISDISTIIVVYENKNFNLEEEIFKLETSGITPPMAYVKERRFEKNSVKTEEVEKIESKVNELIMEDSKALRVEIVHNDKESNDADIDMLAAELENELKTSKQRSPSPVDTHTSDINEAKMNYDRPSITTNDQDKFYNIIDNRITDKINVKKPINNSSLNDSISNIKRDSTVINKTKEIPEDLNEIIENKQIEHPLLQETPKIEKSSEQLALEAKIKEKEEQFEKAANPILKKRFEQALNSLKQEYHSKFGNN